MMGSDHKRFNRREVLQSGGAAIGALSLTRLARAGSADAQTVRKPTLCLFSKPLQNRPFESLPAVLRELDFAAVDLTCRKSGHVLPERVADDLPRAYELLKAGGISIPMITTEITDTSKDHTETILKTAGELGIRYAKLGYYLYGDLRQIHRTLAEVKSRLRDLVAMAKPLGVQLGFHNHSGPFVGSAMWDLWQLIHDLDSSVIGSYFDVGHAVVEGGKSGWNVGMNLLLPRILMVSAKDYLFGKDTQGQWEAIKTPIGKGMVRWRQVLAMLKQPGFDGPISLHMEYDERGQPVGSPADQRNLEKIRRDRAALGDLLKQAELA